MTAVERMRFGPLTVAFDQRVLRPRPWTLAQAEWAAELSPGLPEGTILELAAGAGHIGLAAAILTGRRLVQVDLSQAACAWAAANAEAAGVADAVEVRCGRFGDPVRADERFPLVIADPPYVPTGEVGRFPADPRLAIDGGPDGLGVVTECLAAAAAHVTRDGAVLLQARGEAQARDALAGRHGLVVVDVRAFADDRAVALARPTPVTSAPGARPSMHA